MLKIFVKLQKCCPFVGITEPWDSNNTAYADMSWCVVLQSGAISRATGLPSSSDLCLSGTSRMESHRVIVDLCVENLKPVLRRANNEQDPISKITQAVA